MRTFTLRHFDFDTLIEESNSFRMKHLDELVTKWHHLTTQLDDLEMKLITISDSRQDAFDGLEKHHKLLKWPTIKDIKRYIHDADIEMNIILQNQQKLYKDKSDLEVDIKLLCKRMEINPPIDI